ncbi:aminotransferase [Aureimonas sp. ME7]|uniref:aminotransferase n=1 Tax=Aureimonas sp. ME7 TaxID=2744252 RepID=UPI0015F45A76|nr:aminotransferase [Aureimonas sp. ME7]
MTLSSRLARVSVPPITQAARWVSDYDGRHGPAIDCSQAVPNHAPPAEFAERLGQAGADLQAARYGNILGDPALRSAYAAHVSQRYAATIDAAQVAITSGCNQAFFAAMIALAEPGEAVILPTPWYFNHVMTLEMLGIEPRPFALDSAAGFLPDPGALDAAIDESVRAVVLVSPNNPTGAIYPPALLSEILDLCVRRGVVLVLDETYRDFLPEGARPHSLFDRGEAEDHLVALYSFSKSYAIPGHRVGAMIAGERTIAEIEKVIDCVQICAPRPAQAALPWAIEALGDFRAASAREIETRAHAFRAAFAALPGWEIRQLGAYFAYVRHPFGESASEEIAARLARELGIVVLPGSFFGPGQASFLRIAFANVTVPLIAEIARRLAIGLGGAAPSPTLEPQA